MYLLLRRTYPMLNFLTNSKEYEIQANGQLSSILSQFDSDYVMHVIEATLEDQFLYFDILEKPNAVKAFEQVFSQLFEMYQLDTDNIADTRIDAYSSIIHILKHKFFFDFIETEGMDWYTVAYYLYDFYVAKFNYYMVNFYSKYLTDEKDQIYREMNLEELRKRKDTSSNYAKYVFDENDPLVVIMANLPTVLHNLRYMNIPDEVVYRYSYGNTPQILELFQSHVVPSSSLFQLYNSLLFNEHLYANIVTQIRLKLQSDNIEKFNAIRAAQMKKLYD